MRPAPHRAVLFDLDGVIRRWLPSITTDAETRVGLPEGEILRTAFEPDLLRLVTTGVITDELWRERVRQTLVDDHGPAAGAAVAEWSTPVGEVIEESLALVRAQREVRRVALISNATSRLEADLEAMRIHDEFDAIFNSARLGFAKPDPAIFRTACEALGLGPGECAFVDDSVVNVAAADEVGMTCHHYRGAEGLRSFLASLG